MRLMKLDRRRISQQNAQFWNEFCGSALARSLKITRITPATLKKYDRAYLHKYPYLTQYAPRQTKSQQSILEIGLGFGTFGQIVAERSQRYWGIDIAQGPVELMRRRLKWIRRPETVAVASALSTV